MIRLITEGDLLEINGWYALLEMPFISFDDVPKIGFIAPGICAGWIYQTDSNMCMLDGFIANQSVTGNKRREALNEVTDALITMAKDLCFKKIIAFTKHESIRTRCERYEFSRKNDYTLYVRSI